VSVVKHALEQRGCVVHTQNSSTKALEYFAREKDNIDVVLLDFNMPHLNGIDASDALRKLHPGAIKLVGV
jgi:CheY-like chemotaxis protein